MRTTELCEECGSADPCEHDYDRPSVDEILQEEDIKAVPVRVDNVVRTDEMPCYAWYRNVQLKTGASAKKILNADPRRKSVKIAAYSLGVGCEAVIIAPTEAECTAGTGAFIIPNTATVSGTGILTIADSGDLYARGVVINDTSGTFEGFGVSADDALLSLSVEQWSK